MITERGDHEKQRQQDALLQKSASQYLPDKLFVILICLFIQSNVEQFMSLFTFIRI